MSIFIEFAAVKPLKEGSRVVMATDPHYGQLSPVRLPSCVSAMLTRSLGPETVDVIVRIDGGR